MTKRKDERRELLKEDELLSGMERVARYIQNQPKKVFGIGGAVLLLLALIFGYGAWQRQQDVQAAGDLYRAEKILATNLEDPEAEFSFATETEKLEAALEELDKVIDQYSGPVQKQAYIYKVSCLIGLGRYEEVESTYASLAQGGSLQFLGIKGLADMYLAREAFDDALAQYQRLLDTDQFNPDQIKFHMAECYQGKGDLTQAKALLEEIVEAYKDQEEKPPVHFRVQQMLTDLEAENGDQAEG